MPPRGDGGLDAGEVALSGGEQVLALAGALGGEIGVAADDQTLAGEVGCCDAGHVALVEQRELQGAAFEQRPDRRRAQCGDPVEAYGSDVLGDARLGDHSAVAHEDHMVEVEALLQLLDLCRQGHRVRRVAVKDLNGDRAAVGSAEQAVGDLQRALPAVAAVATLGERTAAAFHVAR